MINDHISLKDIEIKIESMVFRRHCVIFNRVIFKSMNSQIVLLKNDEFEKYKQALVIFECQCSLCSYIVISSTSLTP